MKFFLNFFIFFLIVNFTRAQILQTEIKGLEWRNIPGNPHSSPARQSNDDFKYSQLRINQNEIALLVNYNRDDYGVVCIDSSLNVKWNLPLSEIPMAIGKFHDKILIITTKEYKLSGYANDFDGILIDPASGKVLLTKNIFRSDDEYYVEAKFLFDETNRDFRLGLRYTPFKKGSRFTYSFGLTKTISNLEEQISTTEKFEIINFSEQLEQVNVKNIEVKKDLLCKDILADNIGDFFILYFDGSNNIIIEKINYLGLEQTAHFSIDVVNKSNFSAKLFKSVNDSIVYAGLSYSNNDKKRELKICKTDFTEGKNFSTDDVIDKSYTNNVKENFPSQENMSKLTTSNWDNLEIKDIQEYEDKIVVYKEVSYIWQAAGLQPRNRTEDGIVEVYSSSLQKIYQQPIPKYLELFQPVALSASFYIHDDKVSLISNKLTGPVSFKTIYAEIDLKNYKLVNFNYLDKVEVQKAVFSDPKATIWFNDGFIVLNLNQPSLLSNKLETCLQRFKF